MQGFSKRQSDSEKSTRVRAAFQHLRHLRQSLSRAFHVSQKYNTEIIPSPFVVGVAGWANQIATLSASPSLSSADKYVDPKTLDGAPDKMFRKSAQQPQSRANVSAIFVHAGAGYHSTTNEHIHLGACDR